MDREIIQDYLSKSGLKQEQAHALSRVFAEMATKNDLLVLEQRLERRLDELRAELAALEARLTWRIISVIVFLATVITLLNFFIG